MNHCFTLTVSFMCFACNSSSIPEPYTAAAGTYGDTAKAGALALVSVSTVLSESCRKAANVEYFRSHLLRMRAETLGLPDEANNVPFEQFLKKAGATPDGRSYEQFCNALSTTSNAFVAGVGALSAYGQSLQALAKNGGYDGGKLDKLVQNLSKTVSPNASKDTAAAVNAIGTAVKNLASLIVNKLVEKNLKRYIVEADPIVGNLTGALQAYVSAVDKEYETLQTRQRGLLNNLELYGGLQASGQPLPACAVTKLERSKRPGFEPKVPPTDAHPDMRTEAVCDTLLLLKQKLDADVAMNFYQVATAVGDEMRMTRSKLDGFQQLLSDLKEAHGRLSNAGRDVSKESELKAVLGLLSDALTQIARLQASLSANQ